MGESPKIEARLDKLTQEALVAYMDDKHIRNRSVVLLSALGQMLEREGYLPRSSKIQEVPEPHEARRKQNKK